MPGLRGVANPRVWNHRDGDAHRRTCVLVSSEYYG